jgi:hypothetical protein
MTSDPNPLDEYRRQQVDLAADARVLLVALSKSAPSELIHAVYAMLKTPALKEALEHDHPYLRYKKPE